MQGEMKKGDKGNKPEHMMNQHKNEMKDKEMPMGSNERDGMIKKMHGDVKEHKKEMGM